MGIENPQNQKSDSVVEKKETAKEALHVYLGTLGFFAETNYSGNEYAKWVSQDGKHCPWQVCITRFIPDNIFASCILWLFCDLQQLNHSWRMGSAYA